MSLPRSPEFSAKDPLPFIYEEDSDLEPVQKALARLILRLVRSAPPLGEIPDDNIPTMIDEAWDTHKPFTRNPGTSVDLSMSVGRVLVPLERQHFVDRALMANSRVVASIDGVVSSSDEAEAQITKNLYDDYRHPQSLRRTVAFIANGTAGKSKDRPLFFRLTEYLQPELGSPEVLNSVALALEVGRAEASYTYMPKYVEIGPYADCGFNTRSSGEFNMSTPELVTTLSQYVMGLETQAIQPSAA